MSPTGPPAAGRSAWSRLLLVLAGVLLGAGIAEAGLRALGYRQPDILAPSIRATYRLGPGSRFVYKGFLPGSFVDFQNLVELNQLGFHDRDYPVARPTPGTYRVLVLGDSYVAGFEVPLEALFHKRLEARLAREDPLGRGSYQVIAFGQGATAQETELAWLRRFGPQYRPDVVLLLFFCGNDVMENSPVIFSRAQEFVATYYREVTSRKIALFRSLEVFPRSRLNGLLAQDVTTFYAEHLPWFHPELTPASLTSPEIGVYRRPVDADWGDAFARTGRLLEAIRRESEALGARFVLASLSGPQAIGDLARAMVWGGKSGGDLDYEQPDRWVAEWAQVHEVPFVALGPLLAAVGRRRAFWAHDMHLTSVGHATVAEALYPLVVPPRRGG